MAKSRSLSLVEASASKCGEISTIKCVLLGLLGADRSLLIKPNQEPTESIYLFFEHDGLYYSMRVRDSIDEAKEYCGLLLSSANKK